MSDQSQSNSSSAKALLTGVAILVSFGFIVLILTSNSGRESVEDIAYKGEFTAEVTEARWANLEEITAAQEALVDPAKVDAAFKDLAKNPPAAAKSDIVVPGSPTFMKQAEEAVAATEAAKAEKPAEPAEGSEEAKPAEAGAETAPEEKKPEGAQKGAKGKGKAKGKGEA
ncbi:MAG: hypothetical protein HRU46_07050 [Verrucomicrobiales bacterium]|nr:hypothetical protein [Verrucomicrobiales bacterium]